MMAAAPADSLPDIIRIGKSQNGSPQEMSCTHSGVESDCENDSHGFECSILVPMPSRRRHEYQHRQIVWEGWEVGSKEDDAKHVYSVIFRL